MNCKYIFDTITQKVIPLILKFKYRKPTLLKIACLYILLILTLSSEKWNIIYIITKQFSEFIYEYSPNISWLLAKIGNLVAEIDAALPSEIQILIIAIVSFVLIVIVIANCFNKNLIDVQTRTKLQKVFETLVFEPNEEWFKNKCKISINDLGERYTPQIHFEVPELDLLYDLILDNKEINSKIKFSIRNLYTQTNNIISSVNLKISKPDDNNPAEILKRISAALDNIYIVFENLSKMNINTSEIDILCDNTNIISQKLRVLLKQGTISSYSYEEINEICMELIGYKTNDWYQLLDDRVLFITGDAGIGKSHLLADIVSKRLDNKSRTIFLLGQYFRTSEEIRKQILDILGVKSDFPTFLKVLNKMAEIKQERIFLVIDAINEGNGFSIWPDSLNGFVKEVTSYQWLGLIISFRKFQDDKILQNIEDSEYLIYEHRGFEGYEYEASEYIFNAYKLHTPTYPIINTEFYNPLFLKTFCDAHEESSNYSFDICFSKVIKLYFTKINNKIAYNLGYSKDIQLVEKTVYSIAETLLSISKSYITYSQAYSISIKCQQDLGISKNLFLDKLIDEGLFTRYSTTQIDETILQFNFQLIEEYIKAEVVYANGEFEELINKREWGVLSALTVITPQRANIELFELAKTNPVKQTLTRIFIRTLKKRRDITEKGKQIILSIFKIKDSEYIFEDLIVLAGNPSMPYIERELSNMLFSMSMTERDSVWSTYIAYQDTDLSFFSLIRWSNSAPRNIVEHIDDKSISQIASVLIWCLSTSNRKIRDLSTKGLVNILQDNIKVLDQLLVVFDSVNDPYIKQRLYAVTYACILKTRNKDQLYGIAQTIYDLIFDHEYVIPDILLRDYACNSIIWIMNQGNEFEFQKKDILPPYKTHFKMDDCPTTEEINHYDLDFESTQDKSVFRAQNSIINSMNVEHSSRGMYGDFGRYIFQYAFSNWQLNPELLSNYAIKLIFEKYNYDVTKFKVFDNHAGTGRHQYNQHIERIGKKYQWIAMHELLALVADAYPKMKGEFDDIETPYHGTWKPHVRDIDPTLLDSDILRKGLPIIRKKRLNWLKTSDFKFPSKTTYKWVHNITDIHKSYLRENIKYIDDNGVSWILLHGYVDKKNEPQGLNLTEDLNLWLFIQGYIVDKKELRQTIKYIYNKGTQGRRMPEIRNGIYELFYREFYETRGFEDYISSEGYLKSKLEFQDEDSPEVYFSYSSYSSETGYDASLQDNIHYMMPSLELFKGLSMKFSDQNGVFLDHNNNLICFDPSSNYDHKGMLLINEKELLKYLDENDKAIIWPIIGEKRIGQYPQKNIIIEQFGGVSYYQNREIVQKLRPYKERRKKTTELEKKLTFFLMKCKLGWYKISGQKEKYSKLKITILFRQPTSISMKDYFSNSEE